MKFTFKNEVEELQTLNNMTEYAGSFVKKLADCYRLADPSNKRKLRQTFWDYFLDYLPEKWEK